MDTQKTQLGSPAHKKNGRHSRWLPPTMKLSTLWDQILSHMTADINYIKTNTILSLWALKYFLKVLGHQYLASGRRQPCKAWILKLACFPTSKSSRKFNRMSTSWVCWVQIYGSLLICIPTLSLPPLSLPPSPSPPLCSSPSCPPESPSSSAVGDRH